jgi:hypothetical protein
MKFFIVVFDNLDSAICAYQGIKDACLSMMNNLKATKYHSFLPGIQKMHKPKPVPSNQNYSEMVASDEQTSRFHLDLVSILLDVPIETVQK